jgi:hypothetical protein
MPLPGSRPVVRHGAVWRDMALSALLAILEPGIRIDPRGWQGDHGASRDHRHHPPLRRLRGGEERQLRGGKRRVLHPAGAVGLRQDHHPAHGRRLRSPGCGAILAGRARPGRHAGGKATHPHRVPELRPVSPSHRGPERGLSPAHGEGGGSGTEAPSGRNPGAGASGRAGRALSPRDFRRPETAGGPGAGPGQQTAPAAAGRAPGRPGPEAARGDAAGTDQAAAGGGRHLRVRHPCPARGPGPVAPHRGHEPGAHRATGRAFEDLRLSRPTASWRISSATAICWKSGWSSGATANCGWKRRGWGRSSRPPRKPWATGACWPCAGTGTHLRR